MVQQKTGTAATGNLTITLDAPITPGNTLLACVAYNGTDSISGVTTIENINSFSLQVGDTRAAIGTDIWQLDVSHNTSADSGIVIAQAAGLTRVAANIQEWTGLNDALKETNNSSDSVAGSTVSPGSVAPVSTNNLTLACGGWVANDYSSGPTNSYVRLTPAGSGSIYLESAYLYQTSASSTSTSWTLTTGINWAAVTATFGAP